MSTADPLRIDSHKLMYHPERVAAWQRGETVYPIYLEMSPAGGCNHRCTFCALDYQEYRPRFLPRDVVNERIVEMGRLGLKSIMFGGEGEPLLHRDLETFAATAHANGIDTALTTNGVLLSEDRAGHLVRHCSWIKFSINAGTAATYAAIHRAASDDFQRALDNLAATAASARREGSRCVVGAQIILLPENVGEVETLAACVRDAGGAYLVVKPYSQHPMSRTCRYKDIDYTPYLNLQERLEHLASDRFKVVFRRSTMQKLNADERGYERCLALPFWSYIDAGGNVWGCSAYLGDERFKYGNILHEGFEAIWNGVRRKESLAFVAECLDSGACRQNCRMDEINRYLWELTHPVEHVNFI